MDEKTAVPTNEEIFDGTAQVAMHLAEIVYELTIEHKDRFSALPEDLRGVALLAAFSEVSQRILEKTMKELQGLAKEEEEEVK